MFTTSGTYPWSFVTEIFHNGQTSHGGDRNQNPYIEEEQTTQWPREKGQRTDNDIQNIHITLKID